VIHHDGADVTESKERGLLHRLLVWAKVLAGKHVPIDQSLVGVHTVKNDHRTTLVKDRQIGDER